MKFFVQQKGFTIIELLIVIVVIAILAAISVVAYNGIQQRSAISQQVAGIRQYVTAYNAHTTEKSAYAYTGTAVSGHLACIWSKNANCDSDGGYNATLTSQLAASMAPYLKTNISFSGRVAVNYSNLTNPTYTGQYFYAEFPAGTSCPRAISGLNYINETPETTYTRCRYSFTVIPS